MRGSHLLKSWSSTQKNVTLSSGEAELVAAVKACTEALGLTQLARDWGNTRQCRVHVDSAAAIGIAKRKGNGKLRHVRVGMLWIQEVVEEGDVELKKILGTNAADAMTKHLTQRVMEQHLQSMSQEFRVGRADAGLEVQQSAG